MLLRQPKSLTELAARKLKEAILSGELKPGERLREVELSGRLGISRAPFREATRELAAAGLIEIKHNRGAFVASPQREQMHHMALMRAMIEGTAAKLVTLQARPSSFARLHIILDKQQAALACLDDAQVRAMHWGFHRTVCEESANPYLLLAWASISNLIQIYHRLNFEPQVMVRNNGYFLRTIESGDADLAEALLRSQIIRMAYRYSDSEIPAHIQKFVTHFITDQGEIDLWR